VHGFIQMSEKLYSQILGLAEISNRQAHAMIDEPPENQNEEAPQPVQNSSSKAPEKQQNENSIPSSNIVDDTNKNEDFSSPEGDDKEGSGSSGSLSAAAEGESADKSVEDDGSNSIKEDKEEQVDQPSGAGLKSQRTQYESQARSSFRKSTQISMEELLEDITPGSGPAHATPPSLMSPTKSTTQKASTHQDDDSNSAPTTPSKILPKLHSSQNLTSKTHHKQNSATISSAAMRNISKGQERNTYAVNVLKRVKCKLDGRDLDATKKMSIKDQVDWVIQQAISIENLCVMYEGWTPWI